MLVGTFSKGNIYLINLYSLVIGVDYLISHEFSSPGTRSYADFCDGPLIGGETHFPVSGKRPPIRASKASSGGGARGKPRAARGSQALNGCLYTGPVSQFFLFFRYNSLIAFFFLLSCSYIPCDPAIHASARPFRA